MMMSHGACPEDDDDKEGSGCDAVEGSGDLVLEGEGSGRFPDSVTDDEDFVFVDEKEPARQTRPTPLAEFGEGWFC